MSVLRDDVPLIPAAKPGRCPNCGERVAWQQWMTVEFYGPSCRSGLSVRRAYFAVLYCVALILVFVAAQALGFRGTPHLALLLLCAYPIYWIVVWITIRLFAVDIVEPETSAVCCTNAKTQV